MNSPIHVQLVKWTVPAVAFVIALFWYRRRRLDRSELERNDPGGDAELSHENNAVLSDCKEIDTGRHNSNVQEETSQSSISHNCAEEEEEELTRIPTKISESTETYMRQNCTSSLENSMNAHYTDMFIVPSCKLDNTDTQITDVFQGGNEQILYYETQQPSQEEYVANEYEYEDSQQEKEYIEDTINTQEHGYERDSANHSPVSGVLEDAVTPDETQSEGSMDSGKGGSINENRKNNVVLNTYDFAIPQHLVGRLIGRHGSFLHSIRTKTNVAIYVHDHPYDGDHKICSIQGNADEIDVTLKMIRQKFPEKKFPQVTLAEISTVPEIITDTIPYVPSLLALSLIDGVNNDISVSHIVKPNWLFVNLPTHPTYLSLRNLESEMLQYYGLPDPLAVPDVVKKGDYVAVFWNDRWVRAFIQKTNSKGVHIIRLIDHGGYWVFKKHEIKPLLSNHLLLPFQAIEIFLANIQAKNGVWLPTAYELVSNICRTSGIGQAQVEGYIDSNVYTNIYYTFNNYGVFSLADELIAKGYAEPIAWEHTQPEKIEAEKIEDRRPQ
ncbi:hypothetical protein DMN91_006309 [Ooceraea biroi]|uniref:KH domain-containing protein C56G2.1 n=1 Tax=Ooceraea biroi TaxID=2015173 RepID=A0A026WQX7_OOCBI|nr:KH domain-containing protein akap-1 [Ooceraea biroi]XP_011332912.1 KH domain-containing protein akap-1 [Ooceraea biroi]XP_011332913.1 KH domain-containing protein akap-1 [Ooceraea biroi]XP_011332914.1 KH domain-containing protein akap-1 [Ooceraea biroi]XP_019886389.1 KH domain-containing protein akap-1 [Ooceraea biroi]EZA58066.1 KH domain-containing protein C56G2.1 [Ooceraea biroi]RLU21930.1 hypothetical protein DMN91_006309 [Ooceraea biroi]